MPNIAFFGTPDLTISLLEELERNGLMPKVIVTGKDVPKGRKLILTPPAPKLWAEERGIPVLQPEKIDEAFLFELKKFNIDLGVVVAYGKILPQSLLDLPKHGCINVHYSLLPRHRGASPVEAAILSGDIETGVSIQKMVYKLDAGDVILEEKMPILETDTTSSLRKKLNDIAAPLLVEAIEKVTDGTATYRTQDEALATHSKKIKKEDANISVDDPETALRKMRAYDVWPRARLDDLIITKAHIENGELVLDKVIPPGKKEMNYSDYKKGKR